MSSAPRCRSALIIALLSLIAVALPAGDGISAAAGLKVTGTAAHPRQGGSMNIVDGSDLTTWSPFTTNTTYPGSPMDELDAVYGMLVWQNVHDRIVGDLAQSLTSSNGVVWTLKLRRNLMFSDGTPLNAAAVKYNYDWAANPTWAATSQPWIASWAKGIRVVNTTTLTIRLPRANSNFADEIANLAPFIASPKALGAATTLSGIKPVGAGAFVLKSWDPGVKAIVVRNPNYWDKPLPYLNSLTFVDIAATPSRIATVVQGGATMMAGYPYQWGKDDTEPGVTEVDIPMPGLNYGYLNVTNGFFRDPKARQFLYEAIDPTDVMAAFTQSSGNAPPKTYFPHSSPYYDASATFPAYNRTNARALAQELKAAGSPLSIHILSTVEPDTERLGAYIAAVLAEYGVTATQTYVDQTILPQRCEATANALCIPGGALVFNGPQPYTTALFTPSGSLNTGHYNSSAMNAALAATQTAISKTALTHAYDRVQQVLMKDLPIYVYGIQDRYLLVRNNTGGLVFSDGGMLQKQFLYVCSSACDPPASES